MYIQLIGYLGLIFLLAAALPQAAKAIKQGHSDNMAVSYLILLDIGFIILIFYVCLLPKTPIPILINYIINLIAYGAMTYYKFFPRRK